MKKIIVHQILGIVFCALLSIVSFGQKDNKVVEWSAHYTSSASRFEALEIVNVKVLGKSITVGNSFAAGDEWLKNLIFRVRNISGKPLIDMKMQVAFPEIGTNSSVLALTLFNPKLHNNLLSGAHEIVMPGEEIDLILTDAQYKELQKIIKKKENLSLTKLEITPTIVVKFQDGSNFFCWFRRSKF